MRRLVISGMHRSGTSAVARVVNLLGVDLGDEDRLMAPKPDNPRGFWENRWLSAFNDDLLAFLGGRWDDPPALVDGFALSPDLDPWRERAGEVIAEQLTGELAGWKDPRMSLLLPFWRTVVDIEPGIVVLRDPAEVVASLAARDHIPAATAAMLWLRYVIAARHHDPEALVVDYADLFTDLDATVARLVARLGVPAPGLDTRTAIAEFLDRGLRHHGGGMAANGGPPELELAAITYRTIGEGRDRALVAALAVSFQNPAHVAAAAALRKEIAGLAAHRDELIRERDVAVDLRDTAAAHRDELIRERDVAVDLRDAAAAERDAARTALDVRTTELASTEARLVTAVERLETKDEHVARLEATGRRLRTELEETTTRATAAANRADEAEVRIAELSRSRLDRLRAWMGGRSR